MTETVLQLLRAADVECHTRTDWGSPQQKAGAYKRRRETHPMPRGAADYHFLHITVTSDTDTVKEGAEGAQQVERYGYSSPPMVSYQALVTNEGRWFEGQNYGVKGTHTINDKGVSGFSRDLNARGYAVALMQNVGDPVTDVQVEVVAMTFAAAELAGFVKRGAPIYPHRKFAAKSCPGDKAMERLSEIEKLKNQYVRDGLKPDPQHPARVKRSIAQLEENLRETKAEIRRVTKAREVAVRKGEKTRAYDSALKSLNLVQVGHERSIKRLSRVPKR